jgi:D-arabinose 1-dehydrogenase-like Zn-dependent alcohol dehydrogenase
MRAAVLTEVSKPLQILDLEQEPPKANEVRVQVKAAGVCMSDWHIINGTGRCRYQWCSDTKPPASWWRTGRA